MGCTNTKFDKSTTITISDNSKVVNSVSSQESNIVLEEGKNEASIKVTKRNSDNDINANLEDVSCYC